MIDLDFEERRLILRVLAYWQDRRGDRDFPSRGDIDPAALGEDWRSCAMIAVRSAREWRLDWIGDRIGAGCAALAPPCPAERLPDTTVLHHAASHLGEVLAKRVPISRDGTFRVAAGRTMYRSIILPLSNDGARIDHAICAANHRTIAAAGTPTT